MIRWRGFELEPVLAAYLAAWLLAVALALAHLVVCRASYARLYAGYFAFLLAPWKLASFLLAVAIVTVIAPYTGDPTWDRVDAPLMSLLSYLSAPWVLGVLYRRSAPRAHLAVALVLWLFSASWCYDGWMLWKDGVYPRSWWSNLPISTALYFAVGLMWNLDIRPSRGATFAFLETEWLRRPERGTSLRVLLWALPFLLIGGACCWYFVRLG
ncbi:MAG: hypothetical protein JNM84_00910 [Planctomycetes bacterium]|nr:hypothetical protein [Planctomycetota bacterium]